MEQFKSWCIEQLSKLLTYSSVEEMVNYMLNIENRHDMDEYLSEILDLKKREHRQFIKQFWSRKLRASETESKSEFVIYKKSKEAEEYVSVKPNKQKQEKSQQKSKQSEEKGTKLSEMDKEDLSICSDSVEFEKEDQSLSSNVKRKTKFVPLFSDEGRARSVVHIPGRHSCECQAVKHQLVGNCLCCGRIVCQQEGSGPCFFCGSLVCTNEEKEILNTNSKKSEQLYRKLMGQNRNNDVAQKVERQISSDAQSSLFKAVDKKNKLLEYDRNSVRRTLVIDDQADYFDIDSNQWLSKEEREKQKKKVKELQAKREAEKRLVKVTLDFAGRTVIEEKEDPLHRIFIENDLETGTNRSSSYQNSNRVKNYPNAIVNPYIIQERPKYDPEGISIFMGNNSTLPQKTKPHFDEISDSRKNRLQDKELLEMSDGGWCLSLHQPYASLLVCGLKRHEGRSWYTPHRGLLWIASTGKQPVHQEVKHIEQCTRLLCGNESIQFPEIYPVGAILGCVNVVNCLSQEEYRETYPDGESDSPYVFICENPRELLLKLPIKGQHKIYKLDPQIHKAVKMALLKACKNNDAYCGIVR